MFVTLMKNNIPVCNIFFGCLSLSGVTIYTYEIINEDCLPPVLKGNTFPERFPLAMQQWIEDRVIPNSHPDLDRIMFDAYHLDPTPYGRMYCYQYIGAFMAYMTSRHDDYWINPTHAQVLSYGMVDPHWVKGYVCRPVKDLDEAVKKGQNFKNCLKAAR